MASVSPNPFNPTAMISYDLPEAADVKLTVYNVAGAEVAQLVNGRRDAGSHVVAFDGSHLASGVYLYKLQAGNLTFTEKMILLK
ncbi:MAG: T9SS C-terminal target domain-containing protein [Candidatus Zixiibacteriota bacterium]|nr:MAG: T9SS C-terminal target domain-containing protein [candidate division Zixibacteria bacterium]